MLLTSLKRPVDVVTIPPVILSMPPTFESWDWILSGVTGGEAKLKLLEREPILRLLGNSIVVALASTLVTMVLAVLAAYALARFRFRGRALLAFAIIATRMLPPVASVLPLYVLFRATDLLDTRTALILAYTALNLPFAIWMLVGFVDEVPAILEESAMVDGCGRVGVLVRVVVPLIAPGLAATAVFSFLLAWNDFQLAFFLTGNQARTLMVASASFMTEDGIYYGPMSAYGTMAVLPAVAFAFLAQRHIVRGLTLGAVKG